MNKRNKKQITEVCKKENTYHKTKNIYIYTIVYVTIPHVNNNRTQEKIVFPFSVFN